MSRSIAWLVGLYLRDLEKRVGSGLASPLTLKGHRHHLARLVAEYGPKDANIPRSAIVKLQDKFATTPGAANNLVKAIPALYRWAIDREYVTITNLTRKVRRINRKRKGFAPWDASDFAKFFATHGPGTMACRTIILAICTTARRSDLIHIGRQHEVIKDGRKWLRWKQAKAPHAIVELPMGRLLAEDVACHDKMTYIVNGYGSPFSVAGLGNRRAWCDEAGLDARSPHGVRKGLSFMLPDSGATSLELDVLLGHEMNSRETKV